MFSIVLATIFIPKTKQLFGHKKMNDQKTGPKTVASSSSECYRISKEILDVLLRKNAVPVFYNSV
jgi:hypothetical protein